MAVPVTAMPPDRIFRVARRSGLVTFSSIDPLDVPLQRAGNRFDVPGGGVLYAASSPAACYVETLSRFRPTPRIRELLKDEPGFMVTGGVPQDWRLQRSLATLHVVNPLPFLDMEAPETHEFLSERLASDLVALGYDSPLDLSSVSNQDRRLSRTIAEFAYSDTDEDGWPRYSGIRYMSRISSSFECWAIFNGTDLELVDQHPIELRDRELKRVAEMWSLTVF